MTQDITAKLKYFASLPSNERLAIKIRLDPIIRDELNKRSVILYRGGYFDTFPFDRSRPKYMTDPSINVIMTDELIDQLTFETEYATINEFAKETLIDVARSNDISKYLNHECYDSKTFRECMDASDMLFIYSNLKNSNKIKDVFKFFVMADSYKLDSYSYLADLDQLILGEDKVVLRLMEILMSLLSELITSGFECSYTHMKNIANVLWAISCTDKSIRVVDRYTCMIDSIMGNHDVSDRIKSLSSINDIDDEPDPVIASDDRESDINKGISSSAFMIINGYNEEDCKCFNNVVSRIMYHHGASAFNIPFDIISSLYETDTITDILRVPHDKSENTVVLCKFNDKPYALFIDKDCYMNNGKVIVKGIELAHPDNDYKVLTLKVSGDSKYDYVFDKFD